MDYSVSGLMCALMTCVLLGDGAASKTLVEGACL